MIAFGDFKYCAFIAVHGIAPYPIEKQRDYVYAAASRNEAIPVMWISLEYDSNNNVISARGKYCSFADLPPEDHDRIRSFGGEKAKDWIKLYRQTHPQLGRNDICPCGRYSVGQQKVHEYEALGDGSGRRLYCRLTSFSQSLQTNLRITLDTTQRTGQNHYIVETHPGNALQSLEKYPVFRKKGIKRQIPQLTRLYQLRYLFWSEWRDSNARPRHPKCRVLPTALHPDICLS